MSLDTSGISLPESGSYSLTKPSGNDIPLVSNDIRPICSTMFSFTL